MKDKISQTDLLLMVIRLSLENAERFLNDAVLLINNSSFGHAFALTVLALEETCKAVYCNWAINGFVTVDDDFFKNLRIHKTKQRVLKEIQKLTILKNEIDEYRKNKKRRRYAFKSRPELDIFLTKLEASFKFKSIEAFYGELEKMKQLGLYVDVEDGVPLNPSIFTRDVCDSYLSFVQAFLTSARDSLLSKKA